MYPSALDPVASNLTVGEKTCKLLSTCQSLSRRQATRLLFQNHDTRNKNLIHQVEHRIEARALSIRIFGVKIWYALPFLFKILQLLQFKKKM